MYLQYVENELKCEDELAKGEYQQIGVHLNGFYLKFWND